MIYSRVLPRDLFNEANLLKCVGKLVMLIEDGLIDWIEYEHNGEAFNIEIDPASGNTYVSNIYFYARAGEQVFKIKLQRPLNSRDPWPLFFDYEDESCFFF